ncbi:MAG: hypothetical protein ABSB42_18540 [Tepidisphaeraceae bacterium]|jgi:hypothetical protein
MPELRNGQLVESLTAALETMAFVSLLPPDGPAPAPDEAILVSLAFRGARQGRVEVATSEQLGRLLVDNMLARDPSDPDSTVMLPHPHDPLVELVNIATGIVLKAQTPGGRVEMSVPQVLPFDAESQWQAFIGGEGCDVLMADNVPVAIRLVEE